MSENRTFEGLPCATIGGYYDLINSPLLPSLPPSLPLSGVEQIWAAEGLPSGTGVVECKIPNPPPTSHSFPPSLPPSLPQVSSKFGLLKACLLVREW